jgi:hypothetical protein
VREELPLGAFILPGELVAREMLGSEVLYKVVSEGRPVNAKLYEQRPIAYGEVLAYASREQLFFFGEDGQRILTEGTPCA